MEYDKMRYVAPGVPKLEEIAFERLRGSLKRSDFEKLMLTNLWRLSESIILWAYEGTRSFSPIAGAGIFMTSAIAGYDGLCVASKRKVVSYDLLGLPILSIKDIERVLENHSIKNPDEPEELRMMMRNRLMRLKESDLILVEGLERVAKISNLLEIFRPNLSDEEKKEKILRHALVGVGTMYYALAEQIKVIKERGN